MASNWKELEKGKVEKPLKEIYEKGIMETRRYVKDIFEKTRKGTHLEMK